MTAIQLDPHINFFAKAEELCDWTRNWVRDYQLSYVLCRHPPTEIVTALPWNDFHHCNEIFRTFSTLMLRLEAINADVKNINYLHEANPGMLYINLPRWSKKGLLYGSFGTGTKDHPCLRTWNEIGRDLLAKTVPGMWHKYRHLSREKTHFVDEFRYSPGAGDLWMSGVQLLGAGNDTFHIEKPS